MILAQEETRHQKVSRKWKSVRSVPHVQGRSLVKQLNYLDLTDEAQILEFVRRLRVIHKDSYFVPGALQFLGKTMSRKEVRNAVMNDLQSLFESLAQFEEMKEYFKDTEWVELFDSLSQTRHGARILLNNFPYIADFLVDKKYQDEKNKEWIKNCIEVYPSIAQTIQKRWLPYIKTKKGQNEMLEFLKEARKKEYQKSKERRETKDKK